VIRPAFERLFNSGEPPILNVIPDIIIMPPPQQSRINLYYAHLGTKQKLRKQHSYGDGNKYRYPLTSREKSINKEG